MQRIIVPERAEPVAIPRLAFSVAEAAASTGLSRSFLYELMANGQIPFTKVGARRLLPVSGLESFLNGQAPRW